MKDGLLDESSALGVHGECVNSHPGGNLPVLLERDKELPVQGLPCLAQRGVVDRLLDERMAEGVERIFRRLGAGEKPRLGQLVERVGKAFPVKLGDDFA